MPSLACCACLGVPEKEERSPCTVVRPAAPRSAPEGKGQAAWPTEVSMVVAAEALQKLGWESLGVKNVPLDHYGAPLLVLGFVGGLVPQHRCRGQVHREGQVVVRPLMPLVPSTGAAGTGVLGLQGHSPGQWQGRRE